MSAAPKISVVLCTVRPERAYVEHPDWGVLQKVFDDLAAQTFKDFELIVVDGLHGRRPEYSRPGFPTAPGPAFPGLPFPVTWVPPTPSFWTRHHKVAIARYRNTGIAHARGELIVNIDDCCELPPHFLSTYWDAWSDNGTCIAARWPGQGDVRIEGYVRITEQPCHALRSHVYETRPDPPIYGFGSYPRKVAFHLNGYNEWFDGAQGLEDMDWGIRLAQAGVKLYLEEIPGFVIHPQSGHDPAVIDKRAPIVKCCNLAWWEARVLRRTDVVNGPYTEAFAETLVGPCPLLDANWMCRHHCSSLPCDYIDHGFVMERHGLAWEGVLAEKKGFKLEELRQA